MKQVQKNQLRIDMTSRYALSRRKKDKWEEWLGWGLIHYIWGGGGGGG